MVTYFNGAPLFYCLCLEIDRCRLELERSKFLKDSISGWSQYEESGQPAGLFSLIFKAL